MERCSECGEFVERVFPDPFNPKSASCSDCIDLFLSDLEDEYRVECYHRNRKKSFKKDYAEDLALIYGWHCHYCGKLLDYKTCTVDHVSPLNGTDRDFDMANMVLACRSCNSAKGQRWGPEFIQEKKHNDLLFEQLKEIVKSGNAKVGLEFVVGKRRYRIVKQRKNRWYFDYASEHNTPGYVIV